MWVKRFREDGDEQAVDMTEQGYIAALNAVAAGSAAAVAGTLGSAWLKLVSAFMHNGAHNGDDHADAGGAGAGPGTVRAFPIANVGGVTLAADWLFGLAEDNGDKFAKDAESYFVHHLGYPEEVHPFVAWRCGGGRRAPAERERKAPLETEIVDQLFALKK